MELLIMGERKLMQVLAVERKVKNDAENLFTSVLRAVEKPELVTGFTRTYRPRSDTDEIYPPERKLVQVRVEEAIGEVGKALAGLFDATAAKDSANQIAKADVSIDGRVLLSGVPASHLLFLEKKLVELATF